MGDDLNIKSFVDVFASGMWHDDPEAVRLRFGKRSVFPGAIYDKQDRRIFKIIAAESPRGPAFRRLEYPGNYKDNIATQIAITTAAEIRYARYFEAGVFDERLAVISQEDLLDVALAVAKLSSDEIMERISALRNLITRCLYYNKTIDGFRDDPRVEPLFETLDQMNSELYYGKIKKSTATPGLARIIQRLLLSYIKEEDTRPRHASEGDFEQVYGVHAKKQPDGVWETSTQLFEAEKDMNLSVLEVRDFTLSSIGNVPRRMSRLVTDGKIFERNVPELGASILMDGSGSMGVSSKTIQEIIRVAPASVFAMYFGGEGVIPFTTKFHSGGFIIVLARDGNICSNVEPYRLGASNECDGIALRWLGTQPEPRYWISDGAVTGPGDVSNIKTKMDTAWCLKNFDIRWINTLSPLALVDILRRDLDKYGEVLLMK